MFLIEMNMHSILKVQKYYIDKRTKQQNDEMMKKTKLQYCDKTNCLYYLSSKNFQKWFKFRLQQDLMGHGLIGH